MGNTFRCERQPQADLGAGRWAVVDANLSMVFVDDLFDDREAKSGASGLGSDVRFEGPCHHLGRKTRAGIGH